MLKKALISSCALFMPLSMQAQKKSAWDSLPEDTILAARVDFSETVSKQIQDSSGYLFICCLTTAETHLYVFYHATYLTNIIGGRLRDLHRRTDAALVRNLGRQQRRQRMCTGHRPVHGRQRLLECRRCSHPRELGPTSPRRQRHPVRRW